MGYMYCTERSIYGGILEAVGSKGNFEVDVWEWIEEVSDQFWSGIGGQLDEDVADGVQDV